MGEVNATDPAKSGTGYTDYLATNFTFLQGGPSLSFSKERADANLNSIE